MGYRLFRASYRGRDGKPKQSARWYVEFRDHVQTVRRLAGFTSRQATDELGRGLVRLVDYHAASGGQTDPGLSKWLASLPAGVRDRLVEIGPASGTVWWKSAYWTPSGRQRAGRYWTIWKNG